jgi:hypothetical protein
MRTKPATAAEVDSWLAVLHRSGHLHHVAHGPDRTWIVQRHPASRPWTLHHPVLAMDFIEEVLRDANEHDAEPDR